MVQWIRKISTNTLFCQDKKRYLKVLSIVILFSQISWLLCEDSHNSLIADFQPPLSSFLIISTSTEFNFGKQILLSSVWFRFWSWVLESGVRLEPSAYFIIKPTTKLLTANLCSCGMTSHLVFFIIKKNRLIIIRF